MIHILYSADYELYLGGNRLSEAEVLIEPTARLLAQCERLAIPLTLFADVACLWRYRELGRDAFPDRAEGQLRNALARGHDVQAHLHPHWLNCRFQKAEAGVRYLFEPGHYLLGTLSDDPEVCARQTATLLKKAGAYLTGLLRPEQADYRCLAFRAGGYGLQPGERMILKALQESGYRIDSSLIPGWRHRSRVQQADFTGLPGLPNYWLSHEHGLTASAPPGHGLFEIPIAAFTPPPERRWRLNAPEALRQAWAVLIDREAVPRGWPCNQPAVSPAVAEADRLRRAWWRFHARLGAGFHRLELGVDAGVMLACVEGYLDRFSDVEGDLYFALNAHPKGIGGAHLRALARFHRGLKHRYGDGIRAITFQQAWARIEGGGGYIF